MPNILISNDDGINAPGLLTLKQALEQIANVTVLAPDTNWSACGHARTFDKPLRIIPQKLADGSRAYNCNGSPADCIALGLHGGLEMTFDLVVAGINNGHNLGNDVNYSGTVSCAREAVIYKVPGIAVSTAFPHQSVVDIEEVRTMTGGFAASLAQEVLRNGLPPGVLLNLNAPAVAKEQVQGVRITRLGKRSYQDTLLKRDDPYGRPYYWLGGSNFIDELDDDTDLQAIAHHYISITPITTDVTDHGFLKQLGEWKVES